MTCIVGIVEDGLMVMGGDSAGVGGYDLTIRSDPKVFRIKQVKGSDALIGFAGSFRMGQLLMSLVLPEDKSARDDKNAHFEFLVLKVIPAIRKKFKDEGFARVVENRESGGSFLLAYRGWIYEIESDFQVVIPFKPYAAIGSGAAYALGALDCVYQYAKILRMAPGEVVKIALGIAEQNNVMVRGPMKIISLPDV